MKCNFLSKDCNSFNNAFLGELLNSCGLEESKKKSVEPTNRMTFLGVTFDTVSMTLEVTPERNLS
jgi:hypothetical protein